MTLLPNLVVQMEKLYQELMADPDANALDIMAVRSVLIRHHSAVSEGKHLRVVTD